MDGKISIILSLYKNDKLDIVKQAVESLLNQTYPNFDLHIQYDGPISDDIDNYLQQIKDSRIIIHRRDVNKGLACSLNDLLRVVLPKGYEYIARMDADDISMPERLEKQLAYMERNKDCDCLGTWAVEIKADGEEYFKKQMPVTHDECLEFFKKRDCMIHPTVMFRRSYFDKVKFYPEDTYFGEDTMMWAQGFKTGCKFANVPEYLLKFRLDENFFERRRGWKHATSIISQRRRVNKLLGFGFKADCYAVMYGLVKLMPKFFLNIIYKIAR